MQQETVPNLERPKFDHRFLKAILLRLINEPHIYLQYQEYLTPENFLHADPNGAAVTIARILFDKVKQLGEIKGTPMVAVFAWLQLLPDGDERKNAIEFLDTIFLDLKITNMSSSPETLRTFLEWLRIVIMVKGTNKFIKNINNGKSIDYAITLVQSSLADVNMTVENPVKEADWKEFFYNIENGIIQQDVGKFELGIKDFDDVAPFHPGMLGLFVAQTNSGKTMVSIHLVAQAIKQKKHIILACVEDSEIVMQTRLVAALTGIEINSFRCPKWNEKEGKMPHIKEAILQAKKSIAEYVTLTFPYGVSPENLIKDLKQRINIRKIKGLNPTEIVVVDYLQHIAKYVSGDMAPHEKISTATQLYKDFALESDLICFTHQQVNRNGIQQGKKADLITLGELSGSFGAAFVCDTIFSINRTDENKKKNEAVWYVIKGREGCADAKFVIPTRFHCAQYGVEQSRRLDKPIDLLPF
jgi:hypothetical protein